MAAVAQVAPQHVAFHRLGARALQVGGVGVSTCATTARRASAFLASLTSMTTNLPDGSTASKQVGVAVAEGHLLADHDQPRVAGQGQDLGRLLHEVGEGLLVGEPGRVTRRHPEPSSCQIAVMPNL